MNEQAAVANYILLVRDAKKMNSFAAYKSTIKIARFGLNNEPVYEELPGWRIGKITVHSDGNSYRLSSINGYALNYGLGYKTQRSALRAAWVVSQFTDGVLSENGDLIADPYSPEARVMKAALFYCAEELRR